MKNKKCPYCGRRISYFTIFHEKKHGLYTCTRCKKESKIKTDSRLIIGFAAACLAIILFMIVWFSSSLYNNFWGVVIVAAAALAFYLCTPLFVRFVPLKKYREEKDNTGTIEITGDDEGVDDGYVFNREAFDRIKKNRASRRTTAEEKADKVIEEISSEPYVPVIKDVSSSHASSDAPLKRVKTAPRPVEEKLPDGDDDVKTYIPKKKKPDGSKYTANRKL